MSLTAEQQTALIEHQRQLEQQRKARIDSAIEALLPPTQNPQWIPEALLVQPEATTQSQDATTRAIRLRDDEKENSETGHA
jgi:hypothetical protein